MIEGKSVVIRNETFVLLPYRCVFRPSDASLLVADLHWGKSETFQMSGFAVPSGVLDSDLARLTEALAATNAKRLIVLGDLIHAPKGLTPELVERLSEWRHRHDSLMIDLVRGNHDRVRKLPPPWRIEIHDAPIRDDAGFCFAHETPEPLDSTPSEFAWTGHSHPIVRLRGGGDTLRLPCFAIGPSSAVLPAFSEFTGGMEVDRRRHRIYAIAEGQVLEI